MRSPGFLLLLLLLLPFAEIFTFVEIGSRIGAWTVLLWVGATLFAGAALISHQGRSMPLRLRRALEEGRPPALELVAGSVAWVGALLLLLPGFVTDAIGLALLLPPLRDAAARAFMRRAFVFTPPPPPAGGAAGRHEGRRTIETEWRRDDDEER